MEKSQRRNAYLKTENYDDEIHALTKLMRERLLEYDEKRGGKSWKISRGEERLDPEDLVRIATQLAHKSVDAVKLTHDVAFILQHAETPPSVKKTLQESLMRDVEKKTADVANYALIILDLTAALMRKYRQSDAT